MKEYKATDPEMIQAQKDLAAQDLLKNLSFISQDAEQTANRRQMMFPTQLSINYYF